VAGGKPSRFGQVEGKSSRALVVLPILAACSFFYRTCACRFCWRNTFEPEQGRRGRILAELVLGTSPGCFRLFLKKKPSVAGGALGLRVFFAVDGAIGGSLTVQTEFFRFG
jgi:hypothetical protein